MHDNPFPQFESESSLVGVDRIRAGLQNGSFADRGVSRLDVQAMIPNPAVIQKTPAGERTMDVWSRLLMDRIIFLGTPINSDVANMIMAQMLYLEAEDPEKDIMLYINSPGGDIDGLMCIYDTMQYVKPDVSTMCMGLAASAAAVLLAAGTPGKRMALPNARVLIHQPHGGAEGQAVDIEITARWIMRMRDVLNRILADCTGQSLEKVAKDTDRDFIMVAQDAKKYGMIDIVLQSRVSDVSS